MRGKILIFFLLCACFSHAQHSNELYIKGAHVTIENGAILHVQGDVHLDQGIAFEKGRFNVDGILELRGDFYLRSDNTEQTDGIAASLPATSLGVVRFKNRGFGVETTHQDENQTIFTFGATGISGLRSFYNLQLENDNSTDASVTDNFIELDGGDVEVKNQLAFNTDTRLRTDNVSSPSTPPTGAHYSHRLILSNSSMDAIAGESTTPGDDKRYIEGKLSRRISGTGNYYFPVGLQPGFSGSDGLAAFDLRTTSAADQYIDTWLLRGETELGIPQIYCDIGDYPNALDGTQPWSTCAAGPDGLYDFAYLNLSQSHEWHIANSGTDFTYDIEVFPGPGLDATIPTVGGSCGTSGYHLRFLARDGGLYDGSSLGTVISTLR